MGRLHETHDIGQLAGGPLGLDDVVAVGLVHGDHVGELEHAAFHPLQGVAGPSDHQQQERVDHLGDSGLGLADPDRLDEHDVVAGGLDHHHGLAGRARHPAQGA